jgi:purine-binding chemotaxis protein CheW
VKKRPPARRRPPKKSEERTPFGRFSVRARLSQARLGHYTDDRYGSPYVTFRVQGELYGLPLASVAAVLDNPDIRSVPTSLPFVEGLVDVGGEMVTVANVRGLLPGRGTGPAPSGGKVLVLVSEKRKVGVSGIGACEIVKVMRGKRKSVAGHRLGIDPKLVDGAYPWRGRTLLLLNPERLLAEK